MSKYKGGKQAKQAKQAMQQEQPKAQAQPQVRPAPAPTPATAQARTGIAQHPSTMPLRSMEQDRAEFALKKIQGIASGPENMQEEVVRHLNALPALIRMNGLGQALAFYRMKGSGTGHEVIYRMVGEWLCLPGSKGRVFTHDPDVLTAITRSNIQKYMAAQNEALALLEWLKKFGLALLKKSDN